MTYTSEEAYNTMLEDVYRVYQIFKDFFGEEYVDLQDLPNKDAFQVSFTAAYPPTSKATNKMAIRTMRSRFKEESPTIYVRWPQVTVTNEYNKSIDIQELYAKVPITLSGNIPYESWGFYLNRAEYSYAQWNSGYMHSHCPNVYDSDLSFKRPCLGTGPIKGTILELKTHNDDAEWMLFCQELSIYVTVESIAGGPYKRLESVGISTCEVPMHFNTATNSPFSSNHKVKNCEEAFGVGTVARFMEYYLRNGHLKFSFSNGSFTLGMSYYDFMLDISNCFIDFFNKYLLQTEESVYVLYREDIINTYAVSEGKFYIKKDPHRGRSVPNALILTFKGKDIYLKVHEKEHKPNEAKDTLILNSSLAQAILAHILKVINFRYKNNYGSKQNNNTAPNYKNVRYL